MNKNDIREAARDGMLDILTSFGFTVHEPHELQKDLAYLRKVRIGSEAFSWKAKVALWTTTVLPTFGYVMYQGIKSIVRNINGN